LVPFAYITRLASNEIFSPSNKIHREVDLAKNLSAPRYMSSQVIPRSKHTISQLHKTGNLHISNSNTKVCSSYHSCLLILIYSMFVFVTLGIHHAMRMLCVTFSIRDLSGCTGFSTLSHK